MKLALIKGIVIGSLFTSVQSYAAYNHVISATEDITNTHNISQVSLPSYLWQLENVTTHPSNGTLTANQLTGALVFKPNLNYCGTDRSSYRIKRWVSSGPIEPGLPIDPSPGLPVEQFSSFKTLNYASAGYYIYDTVNVTFNVACINDTPVISPLVTQTVNKNTSKQVTVNVSDIESAPSYISLRPINSSNSSLLPLSRIGVSGTSSSRTISIQPSANLTGTSVVTLRATDQNGGYSDTSFTVNVVEASGSPEAALTTSVPSDNALYTPSIVASDNFGSITGKAGVSGGAATYHIPIELPPGRAGMEPNISLNYSSRSGNGVAGMGWSLSAGSTITRCAATFAQDGFTQNPQFNNSDRLCFNGKRLVNTSGVYGQSGTVYKLEEDVQIRVTQQNSLQSNSAFFIVEHSNGNIALIGNTANSRLTASNVNQVLQWNISKLEDPSGNNIIFEYQNLAGSELILKDIYYTGYNNLTGNRKVSFTYEFNRSDSLHRYIGGARKSQTALLRKIETFIDNGLISAYTLEYEDSQRTLDKLLKYIDLCRNGTCTSKTQFIINQNPLQWEFVTPDTAGNNDFEFIEYPTLGSGTGTVQNNKRTFLDLNGDGISEALELTRGKFVNGAYEISTRIYTYEQGAYKYLKTLTGTPSNVLYSGVKGDINSDGIYDFSAVENSRLYYYQFDADFNVARTDTGFLLDPAYSNISNQNTQIFDINGDGFDDIVLTNYMHSGKSIVGYYQKMGISSSSFNSFKLLYEFRSSFLNGQKVFQSGYWEDMDGDGLTDLVMNHQTHADKSEVSIAFQVGRNIALEERTALSMSLPSNHFFNQYVFADINGDGLKDFVRAGKVGTRYEWQVQFNLGNKSFSPLASLNTGVGIHDWQINSLLLSQNQLKYKTQALFGGLKVADLDSDGKDELLIATESTDNYCVYLNGLLNNRDYFIESCNDNIQLHEHKNTESTSEKLKIDLTSLDLRTFSWSIIDTSFVNQTIQSRVIQDVTEAPLTNAGLFGDLTFNPLQLHDFDNDGYLDFIYTTFKNVHFASGRFTFGGYTFEQGGLSGVSLSSRSNQVVTQRNLINDQASLPNMVGKVIDGNGHTSEWKFQNLSSPNLIGDNQIYKVPLDREQRYIDDVIASGEIYFTSSMPVVTTFTQDNGIGGQNSSAYLYREAIYNRQGRGFNGFRTIIEQDLTRGITTQTDFHQTFPMQGKIENQASFETASYSARGDSPLREYAQEPRAFKYTEYKWALNHLQNQNGIYQVYAKEQKQHTRDIVSLAHVSSSTNTTATIDACGNILDTTSSITDAWGTYTTTTNNVITARCANSGIWWPAQLTRSRVTKHSVIREHSNDAYTTYSGSKSNLDNSSWVEQSFSNYDTNRKPKTVTGSNSSNASMLTTNTVFNAYGLASSISQQGLIFVDGAPSSQTRTQTITYSKDGVTEASDGYFPYKVENAKNHQIITHTDIATGKPIKVRKQIQANTFVDTIMQYDALGRIAQITPPGAPTLYTRYHQPDEHAPAHAVMQVTQYQAGKPETKLYQDALGRELRVATARFGGGYKFIDKEYDANGNLTYESLPYAAFGQRFGTFYSQFDALGRPGNKEVDQHCGSLNVGYEYVGLTTNIEAVDMCGGIGITMSRTYNSLKQLVETTDAKNGKTRYAYNGQGLPILISDAKASYIKAVYNALGQKTQVVDPNQGTSLFVYNAFGELQTETQLRDAGNVNQSDVIIRNNVDVLGRVTKRTATGEATFTYSYDGAAYGYGQLHQASGNSVVKTYGYDNLGRSTTNRVQLTNDGKDYTTTTFYDANYGRIKGLRYPNNLTLEYGYDDSGFLTQVSNLASGYVYERITEQDVFGNIIASRLGGVINQTADYSERSGQVTEISYASSQLALFLEYQQYDGFGNLKAKSVSHGVTGSQYRFNETYEYDELHRLIGNRVDGYIIGSYQYDSVGNIIQKSDFASQYDYINQPSGYSGGGANAVKRAYTNTGWVGFSYDGRGNMVRGKGLTAASYNSIDKPISISKNGQTSSFIYGPDNLRVKQQRGSTVTYYSDKLYEEEVESGVSTWRAYIGSTAIVSKKASEPAKVLYSLKDRLGSTRMFADVTGKQVGSLRNFDPFGKPRAVDGKTATRLADLSQSRRGFTDHEHLDELALIHMNGRVYDYNLGRFMSVDPVIQSPGNSQSINPYSYIMNNPLAGTDPTGYESEKVEKIVLTGSRIKRDVSSIGVVANSITAGTSNLTFSGTINNGSTTVQQNNTSDIKKAEIGSVGDTAKNGTSGDSQSIQRIPYGDGQTFVIDPNNQTVTLIDSDGNVVSSTNRDDPNYAGQQMTENWIMTGLTALLPRMFKTMNIRGGANGLIGKDFEDWLTKRLGGNGGFMIGGRDIDGGVGNTWWEAKSGQYWDLIMSNPKLLEKFKSDMGARLRIATDNDKIYQLHSNTPIPKPVQTWLDKKGITYFEHLD